MPGFIPMIKEILLCIGKNLSRRDLGGSKRAGGGGLGRGSTAPEKFCSFYPHLSLKPIFPALKLPQNC